MRIFINLIKIVKTIYNLKWRERLDMSQSTELKVWNEPFGRDVLTELIRKANERVSGLYELKVVSAGQSISF